MRRTVLAFAAAGLVGAAAPMPAAHAEQDFGGYVAEASATPLQIEIYEPTIPIPAEPQAELEFAYSKAESASGPNSLGLASWIWPGDSVGEGFRTFGEAFGLPPQVYENGYPVQVNAEYPNGPQDAKDEPVPGSNMRAHADAATTVAKVGYSSDGGVGEEPGGDQPPAPPNPLGDLLGGGALVPGRTAPTAAQEPPAPGLPPELAALVDVESMSSVSRLVTEGDTIESVGTSRIGNLSLLGGIITADGIKVTTKSTSNGDRATTDGASRVVGLAIGGQQFTVGKDGVRAAGRPVPIPGLPDDPAKALKQLGVSITMAPGEQNINGVIGDAALTGLRIEIDTRPLRSQLDVVPLNDIVGAIPDETGELKSLLGAAVNLAPKFVIIAGSSTTEAGTVPEIELPSIDPGDLGGAGVPADGAGTSGSVPGTSTGAASGVPGSGAASGAGLGAATPPGSAAGSDAQTVAVNPASAGLPPLASIPGALMIGGIMLASIVGWWLQKIGAFVLGGAGSCAHGLETGVPDLRRA